MASRLFIKKPKHLLAKIANEIAPCAFCQREVDDELLYGKLYSFGDIHCHYFCVLLSCCLLQKGDDVDGLFGFLYPDVLVEIERSKKHKCSYCHQEGASLGCSVKKCKKQFHLPCGREKNALSMFYGNYKSYCQQHAPKQTINAEIMEKVKERRKKLRAGLHEGDDNEILCVICYEAVDSFPTPNTFWPPCCARDAWFHRSCLQRMALSAGMHYLKCPLCNAKEQFYDAVIKQGYYVPDRDAAWELEQNAFSEIYERNISCGWSECVCPSGRDYDVENGPSGSGATFQSTTIVYEDKGKKELNNFVLDSAPVIEEMKKIFKKPKPLVAKKKIIA
ncbi:PHD finger protein 7-like [Leptidea sinapis]|uniref:PHD finger protein 7-like n=1 Tax=Leptidea sinapis TaxID=189913 RepID=UPI0021C4AAB2|nr:PHD finger protein 7-like [Leptidea sinapis]